MEKVSFKSINEIRNDIYTQLNEAFQQIPNVRYTINKYFMKYNKSEAISCSIFFLNENIKDRHYSGTIEFTIDSIINNNTISINIIIDQALVLAYPEPSSGKGGYIYSMMNTAIEHLSTKMIFLKDIYESNIDNTAKYIFMKIDEFIRATITREIQLR